MTREEAIVLAWLFGWVSTAAVTVYRCGRWDDDPGATDVIFSVLWSAMWPVAAGALVVFGPFWLLWRIGRTRRERDSGRGKVGNL